MQRLLNLQCQAVHATAHVRRTRGQPDPHTGWWRNRPRSTVTTRRSVARLISCPTLIEVPSGSVISILRSATAASGPVNAGSSARLVGSVVGRSLITCTGTNTACGSGRRTPRRTRLRQLHSRPRLISYLPLILAALIQAPFRSKLRSRRQGGGHRADTVGSSSRYKERQCRRGPQHKEPD
jgi:hypothetical protein